MMILALKLVLVPLLIALASGATRLWGHAVGGWVTAMPIIAGPIVLVMSLEHGAAFGARAARGTLLGLVSVTLFSVAYAQLARRRPWPLTLAGAWAVVALATPLLARVDLGLVPVFALALGMLAVGQRLMPPAGEAATGPLGYRQILARMAAGVTMVLLTTALAEWLGPRLSGLLASLPVAATVMAVFAHRYHGADAVIRMLRAMVPGLTSFAVFFLVCSAALQETSVWPAFALACAVALAVHGALAGSLWWMARRRVAVPT